MFERFSRDSRKKERISLIIPAYEEAKNIWDVLSVARKVKQLHEVIVVDDGSFDNTSEEAEKYGANVFRHTKNKGKGAAIKTGIKESAGDILLFLDADMHGITPPAIRSLYVPIAKGEADFVKGYARFYTRKALEAATINVTNTVVMPAMKKLFPKFNIIDPLCGIFAAKKDFITKLEIPDDYSADLSILLDALVSNLRINQVYFGSVSHNLHKNIAEEKERKIEIAKVILKIISKKFSSS